ncbi:thiamine pyrophosphokinase [Oceanicola sp. 22II-s10i]|uniref:thiamine diphosphokinase n=1 Tax=Oceanicola sp. 22II-s10i TaxID=1317116 RepID=UPI000B51EF42|nr:thiamine diphosphokinase [Oceanicola sp. 22II-s10i]OWU86409.1 thiamine pyrophosphokinase [Oceanicola sp. 22II-s10i]
MPKTLLESDGFLGLFGGAAVSDALLDEVLALSSRSVAADGGATHLLRRGLMPDLVIGDMDSLSPVDRALIPADRVHPVAEQDTTDFDKALRHVRAPVVIGAGFSGARTDHALAAFTVLSRHADRRCVLAGEDDVIFLCPPRIELEPRPGSWFSLYPLGPVTGRSEGLEWPIDGLEFAPHSRVGTSNRVTGPVRIEVSAPLMLAITPRAELAATVRAFSAAPARWPARA